jgi:hypothetical protein
MTTTTEKKNILRKERKTIKIMIQMYCSKIHGNRKNLCKECSDMLDYAQKRLDFCPWGEKKPACSKCSIHCYKPEKRSKIREIMRYSGPRMMLKHPFLAMSHLWKMKKKHK